MPEPARTCTEHNCLLCKGVFYSYEEDEPPVCYRCRKKRKTQLTFECPLCRERVFFSPDWTTFFGKYICGRCGSNLSWLKRLADEEATVRAQHLWDKAKLIVQPVHKRDRMIPVCIGYAESSWGNRWVGPPSSENTV